MFKALLKKQLLEFFSGFLVNAKNGKAHTKASKIGFVVLISFLIGSFLSIFLSMAFMFLPILSENDAWLYYSVFGVLASMFGIFGSVFLAYNTLYEAKDNDLLLSLPLSAPVILLARMSGLYISTLAFESMVMVPAVVVGFTNSVFNPAALVCQIVNLFILPFFALSISCILGWVIALFSSKIRNKSIVTVIVSIVFFAVYYFFSMRISVIIELIINNSEQIGKWIKTYIRPLYMMGAGCNGDLLQFLLFVFTVSVLFAVVYKILSVNFFKLASANKGIRKKEYIEKSRKGLSHKLTLLKKEFLLFRSIPAYMLNCALGSLLMVIFMVLAVVNGPDLLSAVSVIGFSVEQLPLICFSALSFIASVNNITSPGISLESKNLWLLKSLPVETKDVFSGKIMLHVIVTGVPFVISAIVCGIAFGADFLLIVLSVIAGISLILLCALTGLVLNLVFPKFDWTNETIPIKQSMSSFLSMFTGLVYNLIFIIPVFATSLNYPLIVYPIWGIVIYSLISLLLLRWLSRKGVNKFYNF